MTVEDTAPIADTAPAYSEEAIALEFATRHADSLRYVAKWAKWFIWDGACWREDTKRKVYTLARAICREFARRANKGGKAIASAKMRAAVVALSGEDSRLAAGIDQWDIDPWLLNTPRGVVDLRTGKMREHRADDYMTQITKVLPDGDCPRWKRFLDEITVGDGELQRYLQRVSGYSLTGITREQELFFCWGVGNNGKTVWILVVSFILNDYHTASSIQTFTVSKYERHPTELAKLRGKRLVTAAETEEGRRWDEARIKELTGGDLIDARFMRQDFFSFYPQFKLMFAGNHMPTLRVINKAISRRFNRIPFNMTIPDEQVNKNLAAELKEEAAGILAWMIEGCLEWQRIGLSPPKAVTDATDSYLESQDVLGEWIEEHLERDSYGFVSARDLFNLWKPWAEARQEYVGSEKTFVAKLEDRGWQRGRNTEQTQRGFVGWKLKPPPTQPEQEKIVWLYVLNETYGGNGEDHEGAVLVSLTGGEQDAMWLPKSRIKRGEVSDDGRVAITMPVWLAKAKGLEKLQTDLPFERTHTEMGSSRVRPSTPLNDAPRARVTVTQLRRRPNPACFNRATGS
jgi:putative DNA primase/helicase